MLNVLALKSDVVQSVNLRLQHWQTCVRLKKLVAAKANLITILDVVANTNIRHYYSSNPGAVKGLLLLQ